MQEKTPSTLTTPPTPRNSFLEDVVEGLSNTPKRLGSKYFYDAEGDRIFQQIMRCPEYYLTRSEEEIIRSEAVRLAGLFAKQDKSFDLVELGAGDATKSAHLLRAVYQAGYDCRYYPIDISASVIRGLEQRLPQEIPGLVMQGLNGEYMPMLEECYRQSGRRKVIMFMGANIGNMRTQEARTFLAELHRRMTPGDLLLIGFDLIKSPQKILAAYNDAAGLTRDFNLNLLTRINRELDADFDRTQFYHYPTYDPDTGTCKSYLVSRRGQDVEIGKAGKMFSFAEGETVHTEISQKYSASQVEGLAMDASLVPLQNFFDSQSLFLVSLWQA